MGKTIKKLFAIKLRSKILIVVIMQVIIIMGTMLYFNMLSDFEVREQELENRMTQIVSAFASFAPEDFDNDWNVYQEVIDNMYRELDNIVYIAIYDRDNLMVAYGINEEVVEYKPGETITDSLEMRSVEQLDNRTLDNPETLENVGQVARDLRVSDQVIGTVSMGYSKLDLQNQLAGLVNRYIILVSVFLLIGFVTSFLLSRTVTAPLKRLSSAMETLPQGNTDMLVETKDEIGSLAKSFNLMVMELRNKEFFDQFEKDLSAVLTLDKIFDVLLGRLQSRFNISKGAIFIKEKNTDQFTEVFQRKFKLDLPESFHEELKEHLSTHIEKNEISFSIEGLKIIANEIPGIRPLVAELEKNNVFWTVFMLRQTNMLGVIYFGKKEGVSGVNIEEKKFIVNLVRHTYLPIENALLYQDLTEQERYKKEIEIARTVQNKLLPQTNPEFKGFDIYGLCKPAKETGGDYFDYVPIDDNSIGIVVADVVGKGTSAAFYMAEIKGMIVSLSSIYKSPKELLKVLNARLFANVDRKVFATMLYGVLNKKTHDFTYARAGHNPLLFKKASTNEASYKTPKGIGLGLDHGRIFDKVIDEERIKLKTDDTIILYTDGITEAMNPEKEEYGEDRLIDFVLEQDGKTSKECCISLIKEIKKYAAGTEQSDDIAMVLIKKIET